MLLVSLILCLGTTSVFAQMPKNDEKKYEYYGENTVRRAGSGDLQKRLAHWGENTLEAEKVEVMVDDSTERYVEINVTEKMVESYFGVNRKHEDRVLKYHIKFDTDRKDYKYWVNKFEYQATEIDKKGEKTQLNGYISDLKTAASKSLEEEVHNKMQDLIASFSEAAEMELEEE
jgi:hypothetical protein